MGKKISKFKQFNKDDFNFINVNSTTKGGDFLNIEHKGDDMSFNNIINTNINKVKENKDFIKNNNISIPKQTNLNKNINNNINNNFSNFISNNNNQIYNENKSLDNKIIKENNFNAPPKAEIEQKENEITPDDENKDNNLRQSEFYVNQDNVNNINNINNNINGSKDFPIINNDNMFELVSSANEENKNPTELKDENNANENKNENENADTNINFVQKQDNNINENNENNDVKIQYNSGKSKNEDINVQPEDENKPNDFDNNIDYQIIP
jgi:hypothetical protein